MSKRNKFLIFLILLLVYIPVRGIDNIKGDVRFELTCPNCFDSFYWKEDGSLTYWEADPPPTFGHSASAVTICNQCLDNPEGLGPNRIAFGLWWPLGIGGWDKQGTDMVKDAVRKYKQGETRLRSR